MEPEKEDLLFDVCRKVAEQVDRLESVNHMRFVVQFLELRQQERQKAEYEKQFANQAMGTPLRPV